MTSTDRRVLYDVDVHIFLKKAASAAKKLWVSLDVSIGGPGLYRRVEGAVVGRKVRYDFGPDSGVVRV